MSVEAPQAPANVSRETSTELEQPAAFDLPETPTPDAKPAGKKPAPKRQSSPRPRAAKKVDIKGGITGIYGTVGLLVSAIPSGAINEAGTTATQLVGLTIAEQASAAGEAWEKAADANPKVREALEKALAVTTYGALFAAHVPILIAIGVVTGVVPQQIAAAYDAMNQSGE